MTNSLDRRAFLRHTAAVAAVPIAFGSIAALTSCGSDDTSQGDSAGGAGTPDLGELTLQFNWINDFQFAGSYFADSKGYYVDQGFESVNLITGGPTVAAESAVAARKALLGYSVTELFAAATMAGAPLKAVGAVLQKNPTSITSLADDPISVPGDMVGKKIGVQASSLSSWEAFLSRNDIDPASLTTVTVQYDPAPLVNGEVQGLLSFAYNQPVALDAEGHETVTMLWGDYGMDVFQQLYVVTEDSLKNNRDAVLAALTAERLGWADNIADPSAGAKLAVDDYGKQLGLDLATQTESNKIQVGFLESAATKDNGLFYMDPAQIDDVVEILDQIGLGISADRFTNELLDELG